MFSSSAAFPWPARDAEHVLVSSAEMAALEAQLFQSGLPVEALMEKAALGVSRRVLASPGGPEPAQIAARSRQRVLVLVGPGHNGGDGLVVARELHLAGMEVRIWTPFQRWKPLTEAHLRHARWLGIPVLNDPPDPGDPDLWIDGLFGIGQQRPPGESIESLLMARRRRRPHGLMAIDVPTGLCADTGRLLGRGAAAAMVTHCIGLIKVGLVQDSALPWVGALERIDLGFPAQLLDSLPVGVPLGLGGTTAARDCRSAPWPIPDPSVGKYERGRLLVVAGSSRYRGAAALSLAGASASGCGSLRAILPEEMASFLWMAHPHVVLSASLAADARGGLALGALPDTWLDRLDAVLIGPGIGSKGASLTLRHRDGWELDQPCWERLRQFPGLVILDADGLNRLALAGDADRSQSASEWLRRRGGPTWITPHQREFTRLFPCLADMTALEAASTAASDSGATVLLKGAHTVIAAPDGRRWQILEACAMAARAGLGDVLAGYAAGRGAVAMAAGGESGSVDTPPLLAAAALEHAQAGLAARQRSGPGGATPMAIAGALERRGWQ